MQNGFSFKNLSENLSKTQKIGLIIFIIVVFFLSVVLIFSLQPIVSDQQKQETKNSEETTSPKENTSNNYIENKQNTENGFIYKKTMSEENDSLLYSIELNEEQRSVIITTDECSATILKGDAYDYLEKSTDINPDIYDIIYKNVPSNFECPKF